MFSKTKKFLTTTIVISCSSVLSPPNTFSTMVPFIYFNFIEKASTKKATSKQQQSRTQAQMSAQPSEFDLKQTGQEFKYKPRQNTGIVL